MEKMSNWYWNKNQDNTPSTSSAEEKPSEEKSEHIPKENERNKFKSFDCLNHVDSFKLLNLFLNEHPQVTALVLAHMEADKASDFLSYLPRDMQSNVLCRIATMDKVRLEIASEIERILENELSSEKENYTIAGGIDSTVKILDPLDQYSKESIIERLEKEDPDIAQEIQIRAEMIEDPYKDIHEKLREKSNSEDSVKS